MVFSAPGSFLSGSVLWPDLTSVVFKENRSMRSAESSNHIELSTKNSAWNRLGYLPLISTITGAGRILLGIVHTIVHLICAIFTKNRQNHLQEVILAGKNIGRGLVEVLPLIGNIGLFFIDLHRKSKFEKMAQDYVQSHPKYNNCCFLFFNGKKVAKTTRKNFEIRKKRKLRAKIKPLLNEIYALSQKKLLFQGNEPELKKIEEQRNAKIALVGKIEKTPLSFKELRKMIFLQPKRLLKPPLKAKLVIKCAPKSKSLPSAQSRILAKKNQGIVFRKF